MGFPQTVLTSDEQVVRHLHPHWKVLILPVFWLLVAVGGIVASWIFLADFNELIALVLTGVGLGAAGVLSFWPWLQWRTTHYVFTNERVITRIGVLSRTGRDIPLSRVNDVSFGHSLADRILGCGTLTIESAGERGQIVLVDIPGVEKIQSVLYELVEDDRDQHAFDDADRDAIIREVRDSE
ncbi:MAG: PH domain-containing protein [Dactylosporangium sp.]|nr:PH domain-containing protein [Dactylosporangium sp.]NNJ62092.1 PH domain-containing protein [Dactylosporangium sp.]